MGGSGNIAHDADRHCKPLDEDFLALHNDFICNVAECSGPPILTLIAHLRLTCSMARRQCLARGVMAAPRLDSGVRSGFPIMIRLEAIGS